MTASIGARLRSSSLSLRHQLVLHILFELSDQLHTALVKLLEELLRYVAAIAEEFAKELFGH